MENKTYLKRLTEKTSILNIIAVLLLITTFALILQPMFSFTAAGLGGSQEIGTESALDILTSIFGIEEETLNFIVKLTAAFVTVLAALPILIPKIRYSAFYGLILFPPTFATILAIILEAVKCYSVHYISENIEEIVGNSVGNYLYYKNYIMGTAHITPSGIELIICSVLTAIMLIVTLKSRKKNNGYI